MAPLLYREHLISVVSRRDQMSAFWIPMADISWRSDGQRESHTITGSLHPFKNWRDAEEFMTGMAKAWIDDHSS
jgi:hypothetical protein